MNGKKDVPVPGEFGKHPLDGGRVCAQGGKLSDRLVTVGEAEEAGGLVSIEDLTDIAAKGLNNIYIEKRIAFKNGLAGKHSQCPFC